MAHRGLTERPEAAELTDEQLLARVQEATERLAVARREYELAATEHDLAVTDAAVRGLNQSVIADTAGINRRSLFKITDREWKRRHGDQAAVDL